MPEREIDADTAAALDLVDAIAAFLGEPPEQVLLGALAQDGIITGSESAPAPEVAPDGEGALPPTPLRRRREVASDIAVLLDVVAAVADAGGGAPGPVLRQVVGDLLVRHGTQPPLGVTRRASADDAGGSAGRPAPGRGSRR